MWSSNTRRAFSFPASACSRPSSKVPIDTRSVQSLEAIRATYSRPIGALLPMMRPVRRLDLNLPRTIGPYSALVTERT